MGNVSDGVFLKEKRLFIGGNNSLLGPLQAEFGALTAAGLRVSGKLKEGLNLGQDLPTGHRAYDPRIFTKAKETVGNQVHYIGQLAALHQWYQTVRLPIAQTHAERLRLYQAGMQTVDLNIQERIAQLGHFIETLEISIQLLSQKANPPSSQIKEQRALLEKWPLLKKHLENYQEYFQDIPSRLAQAIEEKAKHHLHYTQIIQKLSSDDVKAGKIWLESLIHQSDHFFQKTLEL